MKKCDQLIAFTVFLFGADRTVIQNSVIALTADFKLSLICQIQTVFQTGTQIVSD